jgi:two-component system LytT family sensor kinase
MLRDATVNWQVILLLAPVSLEFIRQLVGERYPLRLFHLSSPDPWITLLVYIAAILTVSTPIKIWNNARIEHRLQEQEKLLLAAKVEALKSQINPHFLFNTLASVSSLIRSQPETARTVITKLSGLLRKLMQSQEQFVTLRDELAAVDEYLDIEQIRFGSRLSVKKSIAADTLDVIVPSLLLQPLVENCIKHGFARKVGPGTITIRSQRDGGLAIIEVEDDGLGISDERLPQALSSGIGLSNVNERLRVLYGAVGRFTLTGLPGRGAVARVEIPLTLTTTEPVSPERDTRRRTA